MGQNEVLEYLRAHPKERFSSEELAQIMGVTIGSMHANTWKLRRSKLVNYIGDPNMRGNQVVVYYWHKPEVYNDGQI